MRPMQMPDGKVVQGEDMDFEVEGKEGETTVKISDGTILKVRLVITKVMKIDQYAPNGDPIYFFESHNIVRTKVPDKLVQSPPKGKALNPSGHMTTMYG